MTMTNAPEGTLIAVDGRPTLRFERVLAYPVERVWRALTEADDLRAWHPTPYALRRRHVEFTGEGPSMPDVEAAELDPPRLLAHAWRDDLLRWELSDHPEGCLLVLTHSFDDRNKAARDAAGWHLCLDALEQRLAGDAPDREEVAGDGGRIPPQWPDLNEAYQREFGISPEEATPPPGA